MTWRLYFKYNYQMRYNNAYKKKGILFKTRPPFEEMPNRSIITNVIDYETCTNEIKTSKYSFLNFLPLNLFYQFSKVANIYFLMIGIMQMIPQISISGGIPVIFMPLSFVVAVSAVKDLFEDLKRKQSDKQLNNMTTEVLTEGGFRTCQWRELRIGQIVKVKQNEQIPADVIMLQSSQEKRNCYIQTKNLDGETNLKYKSIAYDLGVQLQKKNPSDLYSSRNEFFYQRPNPYIHTFSGKTTVNGTPMSLDNNNILLRGCTLRITKYVIGVVIYTGYDSKIMLNSNKTRQKKSRLEFRMGLIVLGIFITQTILTFSSALLSARWSGSFNQLYDYLAHANLFIFRNQMFKKWGSWILLFTNFVPISLIVTLQMVKFIQGILITKFKFNTTQQSTIAVQSSALNEELGQIQHLFSDKTGTLTCNYMNFKYMVVDGVTYGQYEGPTMPNANISFPEVTNVDFKDPQFISSFYRKSPTQMLQIVEYMLCLCLCHSVIVEQDDTGSIKYNASSPDELAFINFTKYCGFEYVGLNKNNEHVIIHKGKEIRYKHLHTIQFNSDRKRMSVLLEKQGQVILYCKGADNMIIPRLKDKNTKVLEITSQKLEDFSVVGLRTLLFTKKKISKQYFEKWSKLYVNALTKLQVIEKQEKDRLKEQNELKKIKKKQSMNLDISKVLDIKNTFKNVGQAIVSAESQDKIMAQAMKQEVQITDQLLLTQYQRKFIKENKDLAHDIDSQMTAVELQEIIQKDLILIGASAIEDKLQDNVKETIESLRKAGIKVWMLTGDKKQTAINIGHSCGLIDQDMAKLIFQQNIQNTKQQRKLYDRQVCLVITGQQLLLTQGSSSHELISLIDECKSIIACRVTPKQKQQMVALLRGSKHTTAAVGDGANDVNMINMAHVGIGIKGVEGAQAAQCSDYAISEFQMLSELFLYHGRECYRRNSRLILFNFYKNMILVLPQLWFGFYNGFSSASLFDPWISQLYNVLYTSVPIVLYAVFDQQFSPFQSLSNPQYYTPGITNQNFNLRETLKWFIAPTLQSAVLCFATFTLFEYTITKYGQSNFFASTGMVIFAEAVIICNLKILIISFQFSIGLVSSIILSVFVFYVTYGMMELVFSHSAIGGTLSQQLNNPAYYATVIFVVVWVWLIDYAEVSYHRIVFMINNKPEITQIQMPMLHESSGNKTTFLI